MSHLVLLLIFPKLPPFCNNYPKCWFFFFFFKVLRVQEWTQLGKKILPLPIADGIRPTKLLVNSPEAYLLKMFRQCRLGEGFSKHIRRLAVATEVLILKSLALEALPHPMINHIKVFRLLALHGVFNHRQGRGRVTVNCDPYMEI